MRILLVALFASCVLAQENYRSWKQVGGGSENIHYSALDQINTKNVTTLRIAWKFESNDAYPESDIQCNPIIIDGVMFVTTPKLRVAAVDAGSGKQIWSFDGLHATRAPHPNRGLTYWSDGKQSRIFVTLGHELLALDAKTGILDPKFGEQGKVDMRAAFNPPLGDMSLSVTSPGVIYQDLIILGSSLPETLPAAPGDIRAYNVRTGKLAWSFHTIPRPGEFGYETWPPNAWKTSGAANNWAGLTVDQQRGLVFIPTGSTAYDFYGADRHGDNLFANSLLCLDAATGKRKWHFQAVRHDIWDLDFPSAPVLVRCLSKGKLVDAVVEPGKSGYIYVLDRETGESLFPLTERAVPPSSVDGEQVVKSEPVPLKPAPFVRQEFTEDTVTRRTEIAHQAVLEQVRSLDHGPLFTPPSLKGTVFFPGPAGGAEWGGGAYDPETHLYYLNANESSWIVRLSPPSQVHRTALSSQLYKARCAACHGADRKGSPPEYPALDHLAGRLTDDQVSVILHNGGGRMPSFASLGEPAINGLKDFLLRDIDKEVEIKPRGPASGFPALKYTTETFKKFLDPDGYPANSPPWGTLSAINLDTGEYAWKTPLGEYPELVAKGLKDTGSENHGGGVVTAGGLFFIGATHYDNKFRVFDKLTGKLLWETVLPFAANATPAVYELNGKQYVVLAAGGGRERPSGGSFIAFALP
ncbi:MAG TPA: PQQ-binding-like beta-propeller repeat protein [Bryobacteraceae bacterium]|nr:PQQ-binding-like beta-propeller repeat protein [Bryobacteraceae bacterium]